ncbi:MAG: hypothetical protein H7067_06870 [Burkholderiales bacterium]|nr:hypothetical protein [Opitutaceae bacterium]
MTLPPNVPAAFLAAAHKFATDIQASFASTLAAQPEADALLAKIISGPLFKGSDFPVPTPAEREAPEPAAPSSQSELGLQ